MQGLPLWLPSKEGTGGGTEVAGRWVFSLRLSYSQHSLASRARLLFLNLWCLWLFLSLSVFVSSLDLAALVFSDSTFAFLFQHVLCLRFFPCLPISSLWILMSFSVFQRPTPNLFQFSYSVVSDSLRPHELQHARPPCPSPTPRVHSNPCALFWWWHSTISSSTVPFSLCPQSFPASGSFQMSQLSASGGQSTGVSASTSVLPMNTQH